MKFIRTIRVPCIITCAVGILAVVVGCGPSFDPNKVPVQVQINYQGAPICEAVVIFVSDEGQYANGLTGSDGIARMGTAAPGDGVFPGKYKVAVDKSQLIEESDPNDPTGTKILRSEAVYHVPPRYSDFMKSGLIIDVSKQGPTEFQFDLVDK